MRYLWHLSIIGIIALLLALLLFPVFGQKDGYNAELISAIDNLSSFWLSGNSQRFTEESEKFKKTVLGLQKNEKEQESFHIGSLYLSAFTYNIDAFRAGQALIKNKDIYFLRASLLVSLMDPAAAPFSINTLTQNQKLLKDYDYLWIGNYYLLKGDTGAARDYYLKGIANTKDLLKAFDIMLEVAEMNKNSRLKKSFITALPFIRPEDAYFYLKQELSLAGYFLKTVSADDFDASHARRQLMNGVFPVYTQGDSPFLSAGDLYLLLHTYFIIKDDPGKIEAAKRDQSSPKPYRKIVGYLLANRMIEPYIDGKLHFSSPVTGSLFEKLFSETLKREGLPFIRPNTVMQYIKKEFALSDYSETVVAPNSFDAAEAKKYLSKKTIPLYLSQKTQYVTIGDLYLLCYTLMIAKNKEEQVTRPLDPKNAEAAEVKEIEAALKNIPDTYKAIIRRLLLEEIISLIPGEAIKLDLPATPADMYRIMSKLRAKAKL